MQLLHRLHIELIYETERCESGRIGLTANELTWETGSEGSNPSLSASLLRPTGEDAQQFGELLRGRHGEAHCSRGVIWLARSHGYLPDGALDYPHGKKLLDRVVGMPKKSS